VLRGFRAWRYIPSTFRRNPQGLLYEITFNVVHLSRPLWATLETLMHEYVHLWQQNYGQDPVKRNYHNVEFVSRCKEIGLHPMVGSGVHIRPADGVFAEFLKAYGVPEPAPLFEPKRTPKGKSLTRSRRAAQAGSRESWIFLNRWSMTARSPTIRFKDPSQSRLTRRTTRRQAQSPKHSRTSAPSFPDASAPKRLCPS